MTTDALFPISAGALCYQVCRKATSKRHQPSTAAVWSAQLAQSLICILCGKTNVESGSLSPSSKYRSERVFKSRPHRPHHEDDAGFRFGAGQGFRETLYIEWCPE